MREPKATKNQVTQTINLEELLGVSLSGETALRRRVAQRVIDLMVERTQDNKDNTGKRFPSYSKEYVESEEFILSGKSKNDINLTLTGAMLGSVDLVAETANTITVGVAGLEAPKAFNHQVGDTVPKRSFIGFQGREVDRLKRTLQEEFDADIARIEGRSGVRLTDILDQSVSLVAQDTVQTSVIFATIEDLLDGFE